MRKEKHTFYNYQFKHTAVSVANHPDIHTQDVAEALNIHPFMLSRWKEQLRDGALENNDQETRGSFNYLSVVMDLYTRKVAGMEMSKSGIQRWY